MEEEKPRLKSKHHRIHSETVEPEPTVSEGKRLRTAKSGSKKRRKHMGDSSEQLEMMGVSVSVNSGDEEETNPPLPNDSDSFSSSDSAKEATTHDDVTQSVELDAPELTVTVESVFPRNITASLHVSTPSLVCCAPRSSDEG